jgi:hypothetical protein
MKTNEYHNELGDMLTCDGAKGKHRVCALRHKEKQNGGEGPSIPEYAIKVNNFTLWERTHIQIRYKCGL